MDLTTGAFCISIFSAISTLGMFLLARNANIISEKALRLQQEAFRSAERISLSYVAKFHTDQPVKSEVGKTGLVSIKPAGEPMPTVSIELHNNNKDVMIESAVLSVFDTASGVPQPHYNTFRDLKTTLPHYLKRGTSFTLIFPHLQGVPRQIDTGTEYAGLQLQLADNKSHIVCFSNSDSYKLIEHAHPNR